MACFANCKSSVGNLYSLLTLCALMHLTLLFYSVYRQAINLLSIHGRVHGLLPALNGKMTQTNIRLYKPELDSVQA